MRRLNAGAVPSIFPWMKNKPERQPPKTREVAIRNNTEDSMIFTPPPYCDHDYSVPPSSLDEKFMALQHHGKALEERIESLESQKFGIERFSVNNDLILFYTGFRNYHDYISVFDALQPTAANMIRWSQIQRQRSQQTNLNVSAFRSESLLLVDQFFLFLCRVRQGFSETDLGVRFSISTSSVSRIIVTWSNYLYVMLGILPCWIDKFTVQKLMPDCFKLLYPNVRVILDCTEIRIQTPSSKIRNSEMYSNYKSHTTMKGLLGITPNGMISFVSSLYTGSISDKEITRLSGFIDLVENGDEVMVDKGFLIADILAAKGAKVAIPPFLKQMDQFTKSQVKETQEIARLRIHVERAIRRCKEYHIFDSVIPLTLAGSINQLWTVCCLLTNFHGKLF